MKKLSFPNTIDNIVTSNQLSKPDSINSRIKLLNGLETQILRYRKAIQEALNTDLGKPLPESDITEIIPVISEIREVKKNLKKWARSVKVNRTLINYNTKSSIITRPRGSVLILSPWNYPFSLLVGPLVSAIAAGNKVVVKPSEFTPAVNKVIQELLSEVFSLDKVVLIEGDAAVASQLTAKPFNHIFFTGSPAIGKKVMQAASANLTTVTLELGGKSPCIVDESADLSKAASRIIWGKFLNCGQTCIAPDYLLLHENIAAEFIDRAKTELAKRYPIASTNKSGDPSYGRIIHQGHYQRMKDLLEDALDGGCELLAGGCFEEDGLFVAPTLLFDKESNNDLRIMQEEIFGPILPIRTFSKIEEVYHQVGNLPRPLSTYVFSDSKRFIKECKGHIITGGFVSNDVLNHFVHKNLPFGGVNNSGMGRSHGYYGFLEMSTQIAVMHTGSGPSGAEILGPPYNAAKNKLINWALKYL